MTTARDGTAQARKVLAQAHLSPSDAEGLGRLPMETLLKAMSDAGESAVGPVVDGAALPAHPFDPGAPLISADIPMIIGSNMTETTFRSDTPMQPIDDKELVRRIASFTGAGPAKAAVLVSLYPQGPAGRLAQRLIYDFIRPTSG